MGGFLLRKAGAALIVLFRDASEKRRIREEIRRADQLAFLAAHTGLEATP